MDASTIDPAANPATGTAAAGASNNPPALGRDDFLRLLVTKLENQDPLRPAEDTEFVAQLATFSSLEQLISVNRNLESLAMMQGDLLDAQALSLIGQEALVASDGSLHVSGGRPDGVLYSVPRTAKEIKLSVIGENGETVHVMELDKLASGRVAVDWSGVQLDDGEYRMQIEAYDVEDKPMSVPFFRSIPIDGVSFLDGTITLFSGDREIPFESILEFRAARG